MKKCHWYVLQSLAQGMRLVENRKCGWVLSDRNNKEVAPLTGFEFCSADLEQLQDLGFLDDEKNLTHTGRHVLGTDSSTHA